MKSTDKLKGKGSGLIRVPARATLWYVGSSIMTKTVGFAATPLFTRLQSEADYGRYALYMSIVALVGAVGATAYSAGSLYGELSRGEGNGAVRAAMLVSVLLSLSAVATVGIVSPFISVSITVLPYLFLQAAADGVIGVYLVKMRYKYSYVRVFLIAVGECLITNVISFVLLYRFGMGYVGRVVGMLIGTAVVAIPTGIALILGSRGGRGAVKRAARDSLSQLPSALSGAIRGQADKLFILAGLGSAALAGYSVAHSVGYGIFFLGGAVSSALCPWAVRKIRQGRGEVIGEVTNRVAVLIAVAARAVGTVAPEVMAILAPVSYSSAVGAVMPIAISAVPYFLSTVSAALLSYFEKRRELFLVSVISLLSAIIAEGGMIMLFGYVGAGLGILLGAVVQMLLLSRTGEEAVSEFGRMGIHIILPTAIWGGFIMMIYPYGIARISAMLPPAIIGIREAIRLLSLVREGNRDELRDLPLNNG